MAGRPNKKWKQTMIKKHGSEEALKEYLRTIGSKGGEKKTPKGFATNPELASAAGKIGGRKSRRGKANKEENNG